MNLTLCDLEGGWTVVTVSCLAEKCAPTFVVWPGASGGELTLVGESPSFPVRGGLSLWRQIEIRGKPKDALWGEGAGTGELPPVPTHFVASRAFF